MGANEAIAFARAQKGKPYVFGATGPNAYDCSGLIQAAAKAGGVNLSRTTYTQVFQGQAVSKADLAPGDLVFPDAGHVQLYVGNNTIIEAPHSGSTVREVPMWGFWQGRRIFDSPGTATNAGVEQVSIATDIAGVVANVATLKAAADRVDAAFQYITDPTLWLRVTVFVLGGAMLAFALWRMSGIQDAVTSVVGGATKVGKVVARAKK